MKSGKNFLTKEKRISNRLHIISNLEDIIKESIYYRNNSDEINAEQVLKLNINVENNKGKLL